MKKDLYVHNVTGEIVTVHPLRAVQLPKAYKKVRFIRKANGERVMRLQLKGATVDISENEAAQHGIANAK